MATNINLDSSDNLFDNAVANIKQLFALYEKDELGIRTSKIYEEDADNPVNRSVAIDVSGHDTRLRTWVGTSKRNFTVNINVSIWYYHEQLNTNTRARDVKSVIGKIVQMFMKHYTINGFCEELGCTVVSSEYLPRRFENKIMAGGLVRLTLHRLHTITDLD